MKMKLWWGWQEEVGEVARLSLCTLQEKGTIVALSQGWATGRNGKEFQDPSTQRKRIAKKGTEV